jgi:hypothetical protein
MRRILLVLTVGLIMVAMMLTMAMPALAAPNPESAAGECGPPGQTHREYAKIPGASTPEVFFAAFFGEGGPPGKIGVTQFCAPGQLR